jgi:hypothetical protein
MSRHARCLSVSSSSPVISMYCGHEHSSEMKHVHHHVSAAASATASTANACLPASRQRAAPCVNVGEVTLN